MQRVCLTTPHFGAIEKGNAIGVYAMATDNKFIVTDASKGGSLLAYNFNQGWVDCLRDGGYDWFGIIHADICPEFFWLDKITNEAERYNLDAIHAVVPIKDSRGLTSTAIGELHDEYAKVRRLTQTELHALPETFTTRDVAALGGKWPGQPAMCCNTGLLLLRLGDKSTLAGRITRKLWKSFPGFTIKDKITCETDDGSYNSWELDYDVDDDTKAKRKGDGKVLSIKDWTARVVPEDWGFGRWASQQGLRVGGTRKVSLKHVGPAAFENGHAWGNWKTDEFYTAA